MKTITPLLLLATCLSCSTKENSDSPADRIDKFLSGQKEFFNFNGNVLVAENGVPIYKKSFGVSDYYTERPLNDTSIFELASVSKQFTATGIMLLVNDGKLNLTDSLRSFFPELPYSGITLHHMLTHTSGLPDYMDLMDSTWDHQKTAFNHDIIQALAKAKPDLLFKPGTKWDYCNTAYALLASIIEKISGMTFREFMQQRVFGPLNMKHSRVYNTRRSGETLQNYALGFTWSDSLSRYVLPDSLPELDIVYFLDGIQGDGTINSTTGDLLLWDRALANKSLLGEATNTLVYPHELVDSTEQEYYGYGVLLGKNSLGNYISHGGGWPGYSTNLTRYTDDDKTIVVLSNNGSVSTAIQGSLAHILYGKPIEFPYQHKEVAPDTVALEAFSGRYSIKGTEFNMTRQQDTLYIVNDRGGKRRVKPESPTKVFAEKVDLQFELTREANGKVRYYRIFYGVREEMTKLR